MECHHTLKLDGLCPYCLKDEVVTLKTSDEASRKFIADTAENYIDLCRQLGTHRPIGNAGCFGSAECLNCFRIGFAVLAAAKVRNKQLLDEKGEDLKLITQYKVRLTAVNAGLAREEEGHQKTAKQFVDATAVIGCLEIKIEKLEATLDPVRDWYDGDGRVTDTTAMLKEAIADLQRDRKACLVLASDYKRLWEGKPEEMELKLRVTEMESRLRAADDLVRVIDEQVRIGQMDPRSAIADARLLYYSEPYKYEAKENAEISAAHVKIAALEEDWKNAVQFIEYVRDSMHLTVSPELREAAKKVLKGEDW